MQLSFNIDMPPDSLILPAPAGTDRTIPIDLGNGEVVYALESSLERRWGGHEDDNEIAVWVEYRLDGRVVHRSARVHLKKATVTGEPVAASIG